MQSGFRVRSEDRAQWSSLCLRGSRLEVAIPCCNPAFDYERTLERILSLYRHLQFQWLYILVRLHAGRLHPSIVQDSALEILTWDVHVGQFGTLPRHPAERKRGRQPFRRADCIIESAG